MKHHTFDEMAVSNLSQETLRKAGQLIGLQGTELAALLRDAELEEEPESQDSFGPDDADQTYSIQPILYDEFTQGFPDELFSATTAEQQVGTTAQGKAGIPDGYELTKITENTKGFSPATAIGGGPTPQPMEYEYTAPTPEQPTPEPVVPTPGTGDPLPQPEVIYKTEYVEVPKVIEPEFTEQLVYYDGNHVGTLHFKDGEQYSTSWAVEDPRGGYTWRHGDEIDNFGSRTNLAGHTYDDPRSLDPYSRMSTGNMMNSGSSSSNSSSSSSSGGGRRTVQDQIDRNIAYGQMMQNAGYTGGSHLAALGGSFPDMRS